MKIRVEPTVARHGEGISEWSAKFVDAPEGKGYYAIRTYGDTKALAISRLRSAYLNLKQLRDSEPQAEEIEVDW